MVITFLSSTHVALDQEAKEGGETENKKRIRKG